MGVTGRGATAGSAGDDECLTRRADGLRLQVAGLSGAVPVLEWSIREWDSRGRAPKGPAICPALAGACRTTRRPCGARGQSRGPATPTMQTVPQRSSATAAPSRLRSKAVAQRVPSREAQRSRRPGRCRATGVGSGVDLLRWVCRAGGERGRFEGAFEEGLVDFRRRLDCRGGAGFRRARATLLTGYFTAQHRVKYTLEEDM